MDVTVRSPAGYRLWAANHARMAVSGSVRERAMSVATAVSAAVWTGRGCAHGPNEQLGVVTRRDVTHNAPPTIVIEGVQELVEALRAA